jgi:signal transduction histidine kinase
MAVQILPDAGKYALGDVSPQDITGITRRAHLLVVDDENGPRQALRMLFKEDFEVHLATRVSEALEIIKQHTIELIITDLRMPERSGVDLLREVKQIDSDIQVIIFTGYGQLETAMKAVEYGAFAYMEKPFDNAVMTDMVRAAHHKYRQEKERRMFEKLALEASRFETLGRVVSGMMHDMATPLTVINSHIELLLMKPDREDLLKRLETMKSQVQYCADLARSTMNYLRPGQKGPVQTDLNTVINACLKVAAPLFRETRATMHPDLAATLPSTLCEPVLMRQAVMNLITNACHAMESIEGERLLYLSTFTEEGQACIAIEDTGPGIPKQLWDSVFDTFFSTKGQSGTGLGLGVVRNVVRRFNGTARLEEPKHGKGARFVLRLPIAQ